MDIFSTFVHHLNFFPLAAFLSLLLAGLNIPISEDLVIITGALVSQGLPELLLPNLLAIYTGVIISDFTAYFIGTLTRKGAVKLQFAQVLLSPKNLDRVKHYLDKYGILTFIVCRFIPFGVRNVLFIASGFLGLKPRRFAFYDIIAATISVNTLFFLVYHFGEDIKNPFQAAGIFLFVLLAVFVIVVAGGLMAKRGIPFPLTGYGLPQVVIFPAVIAAVMAALFFAFRPALWLIVPEAILFLLLGWALSFFRNPRRKILNDESALFSPADGTITEITPVEDEELGKALRIGMFLSIFNVHLNRAPCSVRVTAVTYKKGLFKDARDPDSGQVNESNDIVMTRLSEPRDQLRVRQVSGAVARHIVCRVKKEEELTQGQLFGMIKFGSRTELYVPSGDEKRFEVTVKIGDPVRAGLTPLIRYI